MPLNPSILASELLRIFRSKISDSLEVARQQSAAYATYAKDGTAGGTLPVFTGFETSLLQPTLFGALAVPAAGTPVTYASAWATGLTAFWGLPPVPFAGLTATGVSGPPLGASVLIPVIAAIVSNPLNTAEIASTGIALALHTATLTVAVVGTTNTGQPFTAPLL